MQIITEERHFNYTTDYFAESCMSVSFVLRELRKNHNDHQKLCYFRIITSAR